MPHLALVLWFLTTPMAPEISFQVRPDAVTEEIRADPCAVAEQIVAQRPCVRPEDCGAFQDWKRLFGVPRTELLNPEFAGGGVFRASAQFGPGLRVREVPMSYLCLAAANSEGVRFNKSLKPARSARGLAPIH